MIIFSECSRPWAMSCGPRLKLLFAFAKAAQ